MNSVVSAYSQDLPTYSVNSQLEMLESAPRALLAERVAARAPRSFANFSRVET